MKKAVTVVLSAVIVFVMAFPVPMNVQLIDKARYEKANANPVAAAVVVGTALAAYGVLVAGASTAEYTANLNSMYSDLESASGMTSAAFDSMLQGAVDSNGNIDLGYLAQQGFFGLVPSVVSNMVNNGNAIVGDNSSAAMNSVLKYGNLTWKSVSSAPSEFSQVVGNYPDYNDWSKVIGYVKYRYEYQTNRYYRYKFYYENNSTNLSINSSDSNPYIGTFATSLSVTIYDSGTVNYSKSNSVNAQLRVNDVVNSTDSTSWYLNSNYSFPQTLSSLSKSVGSEASFVAAIKQAIIDGSASIPTSTVEAFNPTAEQLSTGYTTADVVEAVSSGTGEVTGSIQGLQDWFSNNWGIFGQILAAILGIASNVTAIADWAGTTPFPTIMSNVLNGITAIPGAISSAAGSLGDVLGDTLDDVVSGVNAIPGLLNGTLEGIRTGVLSIPASIADVVAAVQAGVVDLTGAIEAVGDLFFNFRLPIDTGQTVSIALPSGMPQAVEFDLSNKVPFCYLIRTQSALQSMFGNFQSNRSFYFDLQVPNAGTVRFDGEPVLSQSFGIMDIAQTIRALVTGVLCLGLLYRAYKILERQT